MVAAAVAAPVTHVTFTLAECVTSERIYPWTSNIFRPIMYSQNALDRSHDIHTHIVGRICVAVVDDDEVDEK